MKSESFFHFVHSLTKKEKAAFSRHTKNSTKFLDLLLYNRILKEKKFSKEAEKRIRGEEFKSGNKYFFYRIKLGRKILLTLVLLEGKDVSSFSLIKKAVEMNASELANKIVIRELEELNRAEDFMGTKHLIEFCTEIGYRYKNVFDFGDFNSRLNEFNSQVDRISYLRSILNRIRQAFGVNEEKKFSLTQALDNDIGRFLPNCFSENYLHLKGQIGVAILRRDYLKSFQLQKHLIELVSLDYAIISEVILIKEWSQLIRFALQIGKRNFALKQVFDLRQVELKEEIARINLLKQLVILQVDIGEQYGNLQLVGNALTLLSENNRLFSPNEEIRRYFISALAYLYNAEYEMALRLINLVQAISPKHRTDITWEPEAVKLLIVIETGKVDEYDSAYRGAYRSAGKIENTYPALVVSILRAYTSLNKSAIPSFLENKLPEVQSIRLKPGEIRTSRVWDFTLWMRSKIDSGSYLKEILKENEKGVQGRLEIKFA